MKTRKLALLCSIPFLLALCAFGQNTEVSAAYAHLTGPVGKNGFDLSAAYLATTHLGLEGDLGGYYSHNPSGDNVYNFQAGPKVMFSTHDEFVTPFLHLLFGGAHELGTTSFAVMPGGGVDIGTYRAALRLKLDALHYDGGTHARVGIGGVFRW